MKYPQKKYPQKKYPYQEYSHQNNSAVLSRRRDDLAVVLPRSAFSGWERGERVFCADGDWFFQTREGIDVGPYRSRFEAEVEAGLLRERLAHITDEQTLQTTIRSFLRESQPADGAPIFAYSEKGLLASA